MLAAFLGVQDSKKAEGTENVDYSKNILTGLRAGSFGISCVAGILLGIFLRANGALGEEIKDQIAEWEAAGFSPEKARELVVYKNLAIKPNWEVAEMSEVQRQTLSTSFSDETKGICDKIRLSSNGDDPKYTLVAYEEAGPAMKALAETIKTNVDDPEKQKLLLTAIEEVVCNLESQN